MPSCEGYAVFFSMDSNLAWSHEGTSRVMPTVLEAHRTNVKVPVSASTRVTAVLHTSRCAVVSSNQDAAISGRDCSHLELTASSSGRSHSGKFHEYFITCRPHVAWTFWVRPESVNRPHWQPLTLTPMHLPVLGSWQSIGWLQEQTGTMYSVTCRTAFPTRVHPPRRCGMKPCA